MALHSFHLCSGENTTVHNTGVPNNRSATTTTDEIIVTVTAAVKKMTVTCKFESKKKIMKHAPSPCMAFFAPDATS